MARQSSHSISYISAFVIATLVGLLAIYPTFFVATDVFGTWAAHHLFLAGGNPYSQHELFAAQRAVNPTLSAALPIWNPPILFITIGLLASGSPQETVVALAIFRALCVTILVGIGFTLSGTRTPSALAACLIATCTPAYLAEVSIGQYSSFVCASFAIGYLLFVRRFDYLAGGVLVCVLLKPHVVLLPSILLAYRVISERRWKVCAGAFVAIISSGVILELIQSGIHMHWLHREVWPLEVFGSTLPSFVRSAISKTHGYVPWWPLAVFPCVGIALLYLVARNLGLSREADSTMMLAIGLNTIFAPYGFLFDQSILLIPLAYYYAILAQTSISVLKKVVLVFAITVSCSYYALLNSQGLYYRLSWSLFAVSTTIAIFATEAWLTKKKAGGGAQGV